MRPPKPWYWEKRKAYYAVVNGVKHRLASSERKAKQILSKLLSEHPRSHGHSRTVLEVLDRFLEFLVTNKKPKETYLWYKKHLDSFEASIPNLTTEKLKTQHIQLWLDGKSGWSASTKHGAWRAVKRALGWGVKQGYLTNNPALDVEKAPPERRENPVTEEHYRKMLELTKDQNFRDLITFAWECGPRPQELLAIEPRHVEKNRIMFPRDEAKGKKHVRYVYLTPTAVKIVKRLMKNPRLFVNTDGTPWTPYSVGCRFARLKSKLGVRYCLYDFRHAWTDRMLKGGCDPITVATLAGHIDKTMIGRVYSHLDQDPEYLTNALRKVS